jgi:predicted phosphodiesterase
MEWVRARLSGEQLEFLQNLPETESVVVDGLGAVLFCHATPRSDEELLTRISPEVRWREALTGIEAAVVVCGHTHMQFDRRIDDVRLVNSGSVGMPYERQPGAYWTLLGPDVEFHRTEYEPPDIAATGWPDEWPTATPEEATEVFEKISRERA